MMPIGRTILVDLVDVVYEGVLFGFYFLHVDPNDMILMKDGTHYVAIL